MKTNNKKYKLPAGLKKKWVAALRSGKYKQGEGTLKKVVDGKTTYCCLGVLCAALKYEVPFNSFIPVSYNKIPEELCGETQLTYDLSNMNDGLESQKIKKKTFRGIATWIEKNL